MAYAVEKRGAKYIVAPTFAEDQQSLLAKLYRYEQAEKKILHNEANIKMRECVRQCHERTKIPYHLIGEYAGVSNGYLYAFLRNSGSNMSDQKLSSLGRVCGILTEAVDAM